MQKPNRENIELWFENNVDLHRRLIYLGSLSSDDKGNESGVDFRMSEILIKGISILESISSDPITIIMNNPGGDVYHGFAIYDAIKSSECNIRIVVYGMAMSMGSVILQAADYRVMMPNSTMMMHYGTNGIYDHSKNFIKWSEDAKRINRIMEDIYVDRLIEKIEEDRDEWISNMKRIFSVEIKSKNMRPIKLSSNLYEDVRSIVSDMLNFDTILSPEDTIKIGLTDEIHTTNN